MTGKLCKCGCGKYVSNNKYNYIHRHSEKTHDSIRRAICMIFDSNYCRCGCGQKIILYGASYISGHNSRNRTQEEKKKCGTANIGRVSTRLGKSWEDFYGLSKSTEIKNKISKSCIGREPPNKGKPMSESSKKLISDKLKGKPLSDKWKKKIKENSAKYWLGKKMDDKLRLKLSLSHIGKTTSMKGKTYVEFYGKEKALEIHNKHSNSIKQFYEKHPEKHPNKILSNKGGISNIELILKTALDKESITYEQQHRILGFYVDFYLPEYLIIVEVDGEYWHNYPYGTKNDKVRQEILESNGYLVIRFWGEEIKNNLSNCLIRIKEAMMNVKKIE